MHRGRSTDASRIDQGHQMTAEPYANTARTIRRICGKQMRVNVWAITGHGTTTTN